MSTDTPDKVFIAPASEARAYSKLNQPRLVQMALEDAKDEITNAANSGYMSCALTHSAWADRAAAAILRADLQDLGYAVSGTGSAITLRWDALKD